ncbi:MAG: YbjN domain-containing protein [Myxococcota bacterium]
MSGDLLTDLYDLIEDELDDLQQTSDALRARFDQRYGDVRVVVTHDPEAEMLRVSVRVPPPAGAGPSFLVFLLSLNARYWDVKTGLDEDGRVLVHADLEAAEDVDLEALGAAVVERAETVVDLLDDDVVEWCLAEGFGTPAQRERWESEED